MALTLKQSFSNFLLPAKCPLQNLLPSFQAKSKAAAYWLNVAQFVDSNKVLLSTIVLLKTSWPTTDLFI